MTRFPRFLAALLLIMVLPGHAGAQPWLAPGDTRVRHDFTLLSDSGAINLPASAWPLAWGDLSSAISDTDVSNLSSDAADAFERIRRDARFATASHEPYVHLALGLAESPRSVRTFENTPRNDAGLLAGFNWTGDVFAVNLQAALVDNSIDGDELYPDGSYVGMALGNWMLSAGWQERWWGPGHDGSLILSTNARPSPGIAVQRNRSKAFDNRWLSWIGPWSLTSFVNVLDDERFIDDALLFGFRATFKPVPSLEIGLSRTAQFCGESRPCDLKAIGNMLLGKDNRGITVDPSEEPGNQLAGFDVRWTLPRRIPLAFYLQWIGEDGRDAKAIPGSWLRQVGLEVWGRVGESIHRTHVEVSDTSCHEGGLGFSGLKSNCGYNHSIYRTGYRYQRKSIGHGIDGDGLSYSIGSTLVQSRGHSWNLLLRYMEINRVGVSEPRHTLSATPQELMDIQLTHDRQTAHGRFYFGVGHRRLDDDASNSTSADIEAFLHWSTQ